jgi:hypothetical protein
MRQLMIGLLIVSSALGLGSLRTSAQSNPISSPPPSPGSGFSVPGTAAPNPTTDVYFINRAKNLARQAAITANGGLERYRPDPAMFGPAVQTQYVRNADGSITFSFKGGAPGFSTPSMETVATVMPGGSVKLDYNGPLRSGSGGFSPAVNQTLPVQTPISSPIQIPISSPVQRPVASPGPTSGFPALPKLPSSNSMSVAVIPIQTIPAQTAPTTVMPPATPKTVAGSGDRPGWVDEDAFFAKARNLARQAAIKANGGLSRYRPEPSMFGPSAQTPAVKNANGSITFTFKGGAPGTAELTTQSVVTVDLAGGVRLESNGPVR